MRKLPSHLAQSRLLSTFSLLLHYVLEFAFTNMSFGWSVGDIAFALKLLHTVSTALQESCGASSDFAETLGFLSTLQTALQLLQSLDTVVFNPQSSESFKEQCQQIKIHVDTFLDDILKYEPALKSAGKNINF
jgi:hypothetical protein